MINFYRDLKSFDFILFFLTMILGIIGIVIISSATRVNINGMTSETMSQILFLITGTILLLLASFIDYKFISKFYIVIYLVNILLLVLVLVVGKDIRGTQRWLYLGPFSIQPSEFSKLFMIIFLSKFISKRYNDINTLKTLLITLSLMGLPVLLIFLQPALSACLVILIVSLFILYVGGLSYKIIIPAAIIGISLIIFFLYDAHLENHIIIDKILKDYQIDRITGSSMDQTNFSVQAIASGQLFGKGIFNGSVNQLNYLSDSHNDFIFSVLCEEFGFVGASVVLLLILFVIFRCLMIGFTAKTLEGTLICTGVATMIGFQTFFNVGVGTGLLPNTGMPFPFLSSGGSSLWITLTSIGLVINVGMERVKSIFEEWYFWT